MPDWYERWFGEEYLALYPHRDDADAARLVALIRRTVPWRPGLRVLDVGCGPGRHLRALEAAGAECLGLDLSMVLLRGASGSVRSPLVRGDMRRLPVRGAAMDLTVNLFTSFGYFLDDADHRGALREMVGTVRPGGWFVIDFLNAGQVVDGMRAAGATEPRTVGAAQVSKALSPDERFVFKTIALGPGREFLERVRLLRADELEAMLVEVGLVVHHRFGDYDGGPLGPDRPRVILMGQPR